MLNYYRILTIGAVGFLAVSHIACRSTNPNSNESSVQNEQTREDLREGAEQVLNDVGTAASETLQGADILRRVSFLKKITSKGIPANEYNCPIRAEDPCAMVNILIELSHPAQIGQVGHTGIAISELAPGESPHSPDRNDRYYDFGPGDKLQEKIHPNNPGLFEIFAGKAWWDNSSHFSNKTPAEVGFKDILGELDSIAGDQTVFRIPICVTKEHANAIIKHWEEVMYAEPMPDYSVPGLHCTSSVARSFEHTNPALSSKVRAAMKARPIDAGATSPNMYAERILGWHPDPTVRYEHSCGAMRGDTSRALILKKWSLLPPIE